MNVAAGHARKLSHLLAVSLLCIGFAIYLGFSVTSVGIGFPLDDAWIHQTYARNLINAGEWSFIPGTPSAGSTSPVWTMLLAVGYALKLHPILWATLVGFGLSFGIICLSLRSMALEEGMDPAWFLLIASLLAIEWHLVWSGLSGMEIPLYTLLICVLVFPANQKPIPPFWRGILIGAGVWIRPDALTLLLPILWAIYLREPGKAIPFLRTLISVLMGMAVLLLPYFLFNTWLSGDYLPSTFYAKQTEYSSLREVPFLIRWLRMFGFPLTAGESPIVEAGGPLIGSLFLILPGLFYWLVEGFRGRRWEQMGPLLWVISFLTLYAIRLPATYQHGRYAMPTIPILMYYSILGMAELFPRLARLGMGWVFQRAWVGTVILSSIGFLFLGGKAYGRDVELIENEMVAAAKWVSQNTESASLIAAHDIGALGYFGQRRLLDLAGLVTPEVVPILRDETALATYLDANQVDYLMTFPSWYASLVDGLEAIYAGESGIQPATGRERMVIYRWK